MTITANSAPGIYVQKDIGWDEHGWTSVPNALIRDTNLSWQAKGVFSWLASHSTTFTLKSEDLADAGPSGRDVARTMLRELEQYGWLTRHKFRNPNTGQYDVIIYRLHPRPIPLEQRTFKASTARQKPFPKKADDDASSQVSPATDHPGAEAPGAGQPVPGESGVFYTEQKTSSEHQGSTSFVAASGSTDTADHQAAPSEDLFGPAGAENRREPGGSQEQDQGRHGGDQHPPKAKRGTRIPEDFAATVTPQMVAWVQEHAPHVDGRFETDRFVDHFKAKTGRDATKLDWIATWRNWMREAEQRATRYSRNGNGHRNGNRIPTSEVVVSEVSSAIREFYSGGQTGLPGGFQ